MIRGIVFDFDLTLADSAKGICGNLNAVAEEFALRPVTLQEVRPTIGMALADAMRSFWGEGPVESQWLPRYRCLFEERHYAGIEPFPETIPVLKELTERGYGLAVATNRLSPEGVVRCSGLLPWLPVLAGIDGCRPKPCPDVVLRALEKLEIGPENALYVGDTDIDMQTALNARVFPVGVTTGNHDAEALKKSGARRVIENLRGLLEIVEEMK